MSLLFTAPQFLSPGRRRNDLLNPAFRVTMQAVRGAKNTPCPSREPISGKGRGAFLTTGHTTDGGVAHGDQSAKEWWKERETEWKSPKTIRNNAKKFYMPFRIRKVVGSIPIRSTTLGRSQNEISRVFLLLASSDSSNARRKHP